MTQLTLTEPPAEPVTSTNAAMLFHWIEGNGSAWRDATKLGSLFGAELGSRRPFDGPPNPYRKLWRDSRTRTALEQLESEGSIRYREEHDGTRVLITDEGRRRYGRMNLQTHLRNRSRQ